MGEQYSALGSYFEYLNEDCDYLTWSQYLLNTLKFYNVGNTGLDIGCGNGTFTRALYKAGYAVSGVDISAPMLQKAKELAAKEGVRAEFLLGDITKLKVNSKVDFAVAINDCLNYVPQNKLVSAFTHVAGCLKKGGVFVFDVSTEYKLKNILGNNLFAEDRDDITYLWFNTLNEASVTMDLTVFVKDSDGKFIKSDETQTQYWHTEQELQNALAKAGFTLLKVEGHLGTENKQERLNFICQKI